MQILNIARTVLKKKYKGLNSNKLPSSGLDFDEFDKKILKLVQPFTMTSQERIVALINAIKYLEKNNIIGDFIECGVWKGGSAMVMAEVLKGLGTTSRKIYLYDTFEGMSEPTSVDQSLDGIAAQTQLKTEISYKEVSNIWCYSSLKEVKSNLSKTRYPSENVIYVKGKVEDTLPQHIHNKIALLRLDTDWYESTKVELEYLFPKVVKGGVIIIDDYGHWQGCKKAVDEYLEKNNIALLLNRIDYTGRIGVKMY